MIKWLLTIAMILFICWWFIWPAGEKPNLNSTPNLVTLQPAVETAPLQPVKADEQQRITDDPDPSSMSESEQASNHKVFSYLQLYRMHRQWQSCADVIYSLEHTNEAYQPINQLRQKIRSHHQEEPTWPTAAQIESLQRHSTRCEHLMLQLDALDMPPLAFDHRLSKHLLIDAQLLERLKHTAPVTIKELAIANVLALKSTWQTAFYAVI